MSHWERLSSLMFMVCRTYALAVHVQLSDLPGEFVTVIFQDSIALLRMTVNWRQECPDILLH